MSKDFTLFQFDIDEDTVRRVLSLIPGVTPLPPDGAAPAGDTEASDEARSGDDGGAVDSGAARSPDARDDFDTAGAESHLADSSTANDPTGSTDGGPSTPWPGAPTDDPTDESEGLLARIGTKRLLVAAGLVLGLGVIGVAIVWFVKQRDEDRPGTADADRFSRETGDSAAADADSASSTGGDTVSAADDDTPSETRPDASSSDDEESRSYPIDTGAIVGMTFLAVGTVLLQYFRTGDENEE